MKSNFDKNSDKRLHDLLQLKRLERPDEARWAKFEYSLGRKCLAATLEDKITFIEKILALFSGKWLSRAGACVILAAAIFVSVAHDKKADKHCNSVAYLSEINCDVSYVCDDIVSHAKNINFNKIVSFCHSNSSIKYVCDAMSSNGLCIN